MAGVLRNLKPTMEPTGRTIMVREMVGGNPHVSRLVEVRLGGREDRADFARGYCRARKKGSFDQCGRRPARDSVTCGIHGGGHRVRHQSGVRLSPQESGRLSGLARRLKRDKGKTDLTVLPTFYPWLRERAAALNEGEPEALDPWQDIVKLTALRDLVLSGNVEMDLADVVRLVAVITHVKADAFRARAVAGRMVPVEEVSAMSQEFCDLFRRFVPQERMPELLREMKLNIDRRDQKVLDERRRNG